MFLSSLEQEFTELLVNATHLKWFPAARLMSRLASGCRSYWPIACGGGSFIPPQSIRDLRESTRYRRPLIMIGSAWSTGCIRSWNPPTSSWPLWQLMS